MALREPGPEPRLFRSSGTGDGDGDLDDDFESTAGAAVTVRDEDLTESPSSSSGADGAVAVDVAEDDCCAADPCGFVVARARPNTDAAVNTTPRAVDQASTKLAALARTKHTAHTTGTEEREPRRSHHHMDGPTAAAPSTTSEQRRGCPSAVVVARTFLGAPSAMGATRCAVALGGSRVSRSDENAGDGEHKRTTLRAVLSRRERSEDLTARITPTGMDCELTVREVSQSWRF